MKTFIVLLRGINVSGQKKIKMTDLRSMLEKNNFENVRTYIQSGNIVLDSKETATPILEITISAAIKETFGFEVPVLAKSKRHIQDILSRNPFKEKANQNAKRLYYVLLKSTPDKDLVSAFETENYQDEEFSVASDCVYLVCNKGYGNAKVNNNLIERKLKVQATTRNHNTMLRLVELGETT